MPSYVSPAYASKYRHVEPEDAPSAIRHAVGVLNDIFAAEPEAIEELVRHEVRLQGAESPLLEHPLVLLGTGLDGVPTLSMIGVINSLLRVEPYRLCANFDDATHEGGRYGEFRGFGIVEVVEINESRCDHTV